jgi:multidrug efflux pump subunit AcrA (membrane-fusion protein)
MLFRIAMIVLALAGIALALRTVALGQRDTAPADPVAAPSTTPFASSVAGSGIVESSSRNIGVGTPVAGTVEEVFVEAGDMVKSGAPLFRLDTRQAKALVEVARAALRSAESSLARLRALPRMELVVPLRARVEEAEALLADAAARMAMWESVDDPRAVPRDELDRRRYAVRIAEARLADARASLAAEEAGAWAPDLAIAESEVAARQAELDRLEVELARLTVTSPVDGAVLQLNVRRGEFAVAGSVSDPLVMVGTIDPLHVRVDIDENDAWRVIAGVPAVAHLRGNAALRTDLRFVRFEPFVVPKRSLTGDSTERVDTRVLQAIYAFDRSTLPVYVGQQMDVFIDATGSSSSASVGAGG